MSSSNGGTGVLASTEPSAEWAVTVADRPGGTVARPAFDESSRTGTGVRRRS
jgi:hypothetical protein